MFKKSDIHSSLHHQGAYARVHACLPQVHSSISQHRSAPSTAVVTEQDDGGQRKLLEKKTRAFIISVIHNHLEFFLHHQQRRVSVTKGPNIVFHTSRRTILTCPRVCMERMVESEDRKPMASVLGYSPSSNTYMFSVN